jgi:putative ABC transport system ATP-binding protein
MQILLQVQNLNKNFGEMKILKDINLEVAAGEFLTIMGQSGSGKSTLLYCISGMDRATSGTISYDNLDLAGLPDAEMSEVRLKHMGFIFQHSYLLKNLSIRDNIILPGFKAEMVPREAVVENAEEYMKMTGIDHIASHTINEVSGGQLQRAAICRALINQPSVLFGDEPTGALNSSITEEVMDILNAINNQGTSIILVSHDAKVANRSARIIYLSDGKIKDELILGAYTGPDAAREEKLTDWLNEMRF